MNTYACPVCGELLTADPSMAGQMVVCPYCFGKFLEPQLEFFQRPPPLPKLTSAKKRSRKNAAVELSDAMEYDLANPVVADAFPYRRYCATHDNRVRPEHRALETLGLDGTAIYRADDPTWKMFRPPWAMDCRCSWSPETVESAAKIYKVREAVEWLARAQRIADIHGGCATYYLEETQPESVEWVLPPPFEPKRKSRRRKL